MAGIFTRPEIAKILGDENLTADERLDRIMSLRGRDLDEGYVTKSAAKAAQETALTNAKAEWEKSLEKPNVTESEEYKTLQGQFEAYKTMQSARNSEEFRDVKPKFFETVYGMIQHGEGAKPVKDQLETIKAGYEEYFNPVQNQSKPQFGSPDKGAMPTGKEGAVEAFSNAWGFVPRKG